MRVTIDDYLNERANKSDLELALTSWRVRPERNSEISKLKAELEASQKAHWERVKIAAKYREVLELLCYSNAGAEGTLTNSNFPEWYRNRLKDAQEALKEAEA